jgi:hypothetical protein
MLPLRCVAISFSFVLPNYVDLKPLPAPAPLFPVAPSFKHKRHPWNASFHFSFSILRQSVGLLGRGIRPSQGRYLHRTQTQTDIQALSGIWTHDPSVRVSEDCSCLRPRGHCDRLWNHQTTKNCIYGVMHTGTVTNKQSRKAASCYLRCKKEGGAGRNDTRILGLMCFHWNKN